MVLLGLTGHPVGRQKSPEDSLPGLYWDPKSLLPRPCESQELDSHGRENEGVCRWMDVYNPRWLHVGHNTEAAAVIQLEALVKPTHKFEVKVPKAQDGKMASEVRSMLSRGTIGVGSGNKGFLTYPYLIPKKNGESHFIMNLKPLNWFLSCTKFKMTILKQIREAIHPGQWTVLLDIKWAYFHIPMARRHCCFLCFRWRGKVYQFRTLPFGLSTALKTILMVMKPILLHCQKMGITVFVHMDDALVLTKSYT